jgi:hypothetical protein
MISVTENFNLHCIKKYESGKNGMVIQLARIQPASLASSIAMHRLVHYPIDFHEACLTGCGIQKLERDMLWFLWIRPSHMSSSAGRISVRSFEG